MKHFHKIKCYLNSYHLRRVGEKMEYGRQKYDSGVICLFADENNTNTLANSVSREVQENTISFALVFFSKKHWTDQDIKQLLIKSGPNVKYAACSTAGEITPNGMTDGKIIIILFSKGNFEIETFQIANRGDTNMEEVVSKVAGFKNEFFTATKDQNQTSPFAICLMDGMSFMEESITAALHWGLEDIPLLGGSAGDNLDFNETSLILNGETIDQCAIILLVKSQVPIQLFKTDNFIPTSEKLVVTHSQPDKRIVHELNGLPAAQIYAETIGTDANNLTPQSFASHPLVVRVGGEYYCRSIQKVNADGSLTFFCAIDDGIVLTVAEPTGMARSTDSAISEIKNTLGEIDFVLGFDCVLRKIDAHNRQVTHKISEIYQDNNVIGFNTYGEQYRSMHLNQTFTGIAFGIAQNNEKSNVA